MRDVSLSMIRYVLHSLGMIFPEPCQAAGLWTPLCHAVWPGIRAWVLPSSAHGEWGPKLKFLTGKPAETQGPPWRPDIY